MDLSESQLLDIVLNSGNDFGERIDAVIKLTSEDSFFKVAMNSDKNLLRARAAMKLENAMNILKVLEKDKDPDVRHSAIQALAKSSPGLLFDFFDDPYYDLVSAYAMQSVKKELKGDQASDLDEKLCHLYNTTNEDATKTELASYIDNQDFLKKIFNENKDDINEITTIENVLGRISDLDFLKSIAANKNYQAWVRKCVVDKFKDEEFMLKDLLLIVRDDEIQERIKGWIENKFS